MCVMTAAMRRSALVDGLGRIVIGMVVAIVCKIMLLLFQHVQVLQQLNGVLVGLAGGAAEQPGDAA